MARVGADLLIGHMIYKGWAPSPHSLLYKAHKWLHKYIAADSLVRHTPTKADWPPVRGAITGFGLPHKRGPDWSPSEDPVDTRECKPAQP
jgi:hypothetical protein